MEHPIDLALRLATEAHAGQLDAGGYPTILKALAVGLMGQTDEEKTTGFLLDAVDSGRCTPEALLEAGIPAGIVQALRVLKHTEGQTAEAHARAVIDTQNPIALQVLYHDLLHRYDHEPTLSQPLELVKAAIERCSRIELYRHEGDSSVAIFAGGCFWGVQHEFEKITGVLRTLVGYTGGQEAYPTYGAVRAHQTTHVEAVLVEYDPRQVSYVDLCKVFFEMHDPAQTDGVGSDIGPQYRSCIFYADAQQHADALAVIDLLRQKGYEVNTLLLPAAPFWMGEEYHQKYYERTGGEPYCHFRIRKF